jgi:hypothetical protein
MRQILRRTSLLLVPFAIAALVVGIPTAAPDTTGLQDVTLTCSDGTNLAMTLDTATVAALTDAVNAMALYPAGDPPLSCGVIQNPVVVGTTATTSTGLSYHALRRKALIRAHRSSSTRTLASGNPNSDYAVGGGQEFAFPTTGPCRMNFGFDGYVPTATTTGTPARGTFNETVPGGCAGFGDTGQLRVNITCVYVNDNQADMNGTVMTATGPFATAGSDFATSGQAYISATDNGPFPGDEVRIKPAADVAPSPGSPCGRVLSETPLVNGSINIHDATP